jgi:ATP-dependent exoDNAse (exonuclease V) beta subunit
MLTIYNASAGTGKTHTLTGDYLSLLFNAQDGFRYKHILAVTFTNKATAEMKSRIIEELFKIADGQDSDYMAMLLDNGKKTEEAVRANAKRLLVSILHDYSSFNISTIDHFFQHTIRAFTREIGLQGNYQIEMEENLMLEEAVENLLSGLERSNDPALMNWLLLFMENKIEEGEGWDIRRDVIILGKQLFRETFKSFDQEILKDIKDKKILQQYKSGLYRIITSTREKARELGEKGMSLMSSHGVEPSDFINGGRSPFFTFKQLAAGSMKEPAKTFCGLADNVDGYLPKKASPEQRTGAERLYSAGMNDLIKNVVRLFSNLTSYNTANAINRNFYSLGILTDLSLQISQWRDDNNKMLLADTTELLCRVINDSEIPFIYEKTGTRIYNYMIDEFQDTSKMQWQNFMPLLKDSLDNGRDNLVVGDVKQSIYRFRNSDWTLLDSGIKRDFPKQLKEEFLETNWRSFRHIVEFNNTLFSDIPEILQESYNGEVRESSLTETEKKDNYTRITSAYSHAEQYVAPPFKEKNGHVRVQFLVDDDERKWKEQSMAQLPSVVETLQDNGYELHDIAILTRTGAEGLLAAETLLNYKEEHPGSSYKYDIISDDSLTINSSSAVRWMVSMLKYLNNPDIESNYYMARMTYSVMKNRKNGAGIPFGTESPDDSGLMNKEELFTKNKELESSHEDLYSEKMFGDLKYKANNELLMLSNRSLYEVAEGLFRVYEEDIPDNEIIFIQAFMDIIAEYSNNETADISRFLNWWNENGSGKKIATPDSQNAIRVMTIHKSKGLGFKVVILPFGEWKSDQKDTILWCRPTVAPFNNISLVPVKYSKVLKDTIFAKEYFHEKLHAYMDNLNTLYVACTRAREELIIFAPKPKTETITIARLLWDSLSNDIQYPDSGVYERGEWWKNTVKNKAGSGTEEILVDRFNSISPDDRMQLRLSRKGVFIDDEKRKYGTLIHDILSNIETYNDIDPAIEKKYFSGEINKIECTSIKSRIRSFLENPLMGSWFDGSMKVLNEVQILHNSGRSNRPDRVMIGKDKRVVVVDYKSGDRKDKIYEKQVAGYMALLSKMGYENVEGYVWYLTLNSIEKCIL